MSGFRDLFNLTMRWWSATSVPVADDDFFDVFAEATATPVFTGEATGTPVFFASTSETSAEFGAD